MFHSNANPDLFCWPSYVSQITRLWMSLLTVKLNALLYLITKPFKISLYSYIIFHHKMKYVKWIPFISGTHTRPSARK